jgi:hypothetical protein
MKSPNSVNVTRANSVNVTSPKPVSVATLNLCYVCNTLKKLKNWNKYRDGVACDGCYRRRGKDLKDVDRESTFFSLNRVTAFKHIETQTDEDQPACVVVGEVQEEDAATQTNDEVHASTLASIATVPGQITVDNNNVKVEAIDGMEIVSGPVFFGNDGSATNITLRDIRTKDREKAMAAVLNFHTRQDAHILTVYKEVRTYKRQLAATKQELAASKQELAASKQELAATKQELKTARELVPVQQTLVAVKQEV